MITGRLTYSILADCLVHVSIRFWSTLTSQQDVQSLMLEQAGVML
jgi:hypothetical protein